MTENRIYTFEDRTAEVTPWDNKEKMDVNNTIKHEQSLRDP